MMAFGFRRPSAFIIGNSGFEAGYVDVVGIGVDIHEYGLCLCQRDNFGGRGKCKARHEDRIAGTNARCIQRQKKRICSVRAGNDMLDADIVGKLSFELCDLRAEDVFAALYNTIDGRRETIADTFTLRAEVDELHFLFLISRVGR